jgi:hypothetical protein
MKYFLISAFLSVGLSCFAQNWPEFNPELAAKYSADDYGIKTYVVAFLTRGPNGDQYTAEEKAEIQKGHLANITRLDPLWIEVIFVGYFFSMLEP